MIKDTEERIRRDHKQARLSRPALCCGGAACACASFFATLFTMVRRLSFLALCISLGPFACIVQKLTVVLVLLASGQSMFSFGSRTSDRISIVFDGERPTKKIGSSETVLPIFAKDERVSGKVRINCDDGKKLEHQGIKIEILGQTEMFYDRGNFYEFCSAVRELAIPGVLTESKVRRLSATREAAVLMDHTNTLAFPLFFTHRNLASTSVPRRSNSSRTMGSTCD